MAISGVAAIAQPAPQDAGPRGPRAERWTQEDRQALTDARVASIKAGLKLTPEQETLWAPVEKAIRDRAAARAEEMQERRTRMQERRASGERPQRPDMMQMLERRSEWASKAASGLQEMTTAMKPFWASLNDQQKKLLPVLMRPDGEPRGRREQRADRRGHGGRGGPSHHQAPAANR
jgi:hypothetical protein